jgi:hypothetical protein
VPIHGGDCVTFAHVYIANEEVRVAVGAVRASDDDGHAKEGARPNRAPALQAYSVTLPKAAGR